jgi:ornithine decarboxylase
MPMMLFTSLPNVAYLPRQTYDLRSLPMVRPYYAMKCNQDPMLLKWLAEKGAGFDCASGTELQVAARLFEGTSGFTTSSIFANPCKPPRDLRLAADLRSGPTVVDSVEEIEKLNEIKWTRGSLIRIAVDDMGSKMPFSKSLEHRLADAFKFQAAAKKLNQTSTGILVSRRFRMSGASTI